jgi:hypothetical protein
MQSEGLKYVELSHASRAEYHGGFADLNIGLHAPAERLSRRHFFRSGPWSDQDKALSLEPIDV